MTDEAFPLADDVAAFPVEDASPAPRTLLVLTPDEEEAFVAASIKVTEIHW